MPITLEERSRGICSFEVFHILLCPILRAEFELKSDWAVENVPSLNFIDNGRMCTVTNEQ
jgi:hypothetical protein